MPEPSNKPTETPPSSPSQKAERGTPSSRRQRIHISLLLVTVGGILFALVTVGRDNNRLKTLGRLVYGDKQSLPGNRPPLPSTGAIEEFALTDLTIPREEIIHGGPAKDGISALTNVEFRFIEDL